MKVKVVGCKISEGEYQGNKFKNYIVYAISSVKSDKELFGVCPQSIKLKSKFVEDNNIDLKALNQKVVEFYYDAYGNVVKIDE